MTSDDDQSHFGAQSFAEFQNLALPNLVPLRPWPPSKLSSLKFVSSANPSSPSSPSPSSTVRRNGTSSSPTKRRRSTCRRRPTVASRSRSKTRLFGWKSNCRRRIPPNPRRSLSVKVADVDRREQDKWQGYHYGSAHPDWQWRVSDALNVFGRLLAKLLKVSPRRNPVFELLVHCPSADPRLSREAHRGKGSATPGGTFATGAKASC